MTEQERKFADLTLRWTRDSSAVAAEYRHRAADIDARRVAALTALPGASPVTTAFHADIRKAAVSRDEAIRKAEQAFDDRRHDTDLDASDRVDALARDAHESDLVALADREQAIRTAGEKRDARIADVHRLPLAQQSVLLREAEALYASAVAAARTEYNRRLLQSHDAMQAKQRRAEDEARSGRERAAAQLEQAKQLAAETYAADLAAAEARRLRALAALPGAAAVDAGFTSERAALEAERVEREAELLAAFRRDRAALGMPERVAPASGAAGRP